MVEPIVVWILVGGVVVLVGRRFYRFLKGNTGSCGSGDGACSQIRTCDHSESVGRVRKDPDYVSVDVLLDRPEKP